MHYQRGSEWCKWDLHIHTPLSIIQEYGGDQVEVWNTFIEKLSNLPPEIKIIGITDYLFIDGYKYLLSRRGEFKNIELIIPNIEFRLNKFSGSRDKRLNYHVLFNPIVDVEDIQSQLLNGLSNAYNINDGSKWQSIPDRRSLQRLGKKIKENAPSNNNIHTKSDLEVGFDNITYDVEDILKLLKNDCFRGKYITGIGYAEWSQLGVPPRTPDKVPLSSEKQ